MKIGIDASRAFIKNRTGIEEYSFQVINHLKKELAGLEVVLYTRPKTDDWVKKFKLPAKWKVQEIK